MKAHVLCSTLLFAACATPPKPRELVVLEELKMTQDARAAQKRAPKLSESAEKALKSSQANWQDDELEASRRDALMGTIKLKTAIALVQQDRARARSGQAQAELEKSEKDYAQLAKDLQVTNEQIALMEKLQAERSTAASERAKAEAEQQKLNAQLAEEQQRTQAQRAASDAELALKNADTVDAKTYAPNEYSVASDGLARARVELGQSAWTAAKVSADLARQKAEMALAVARPIFQQAEAGKAKHTQDDALARDAAAIPGLAVRLDRKGDMTRLVLPLQDLFKRKKTTIDKGHEGVLGAVASLAQKYPTYPLLIVGHTDNKGRSDPLLTLSSARAQAVFNALVSRGVDARRCQVSGRAGDEPIADNRSSSGRKQNNRVEVIFLY